jgi:integrase
MSNLRRIPYTKPLPAGAEVITRKGQRFARFKDRKGKTVEAPLNDDGTRIQLLSKKWYGEYKDADGVEQCVPLSTDKTAAGQMLAELVKKAELGKAGISDPFEAHRKRPLAEHLADFEADLKAKGSTPKQVRLKIGRIRRLLKGCQFVFMADLSASRVQQYLADLRENGRVLPSLDPAKESFTRAELAQSIGVKAATVNTLVRRHRLEASGNGKARRFPRSTAVALHERLGRGAGIQTANYYLREIKAFCRWLVKDRRAADNPLAHMQGGNARQDRRHDRRALPLEELRLVIQAAQQSDRDFRSLLGPDRAILYSLACASGFRASELASLSPDSFALDDEPPTVTLFAEHAKNGKTAVQPLPPDIVDTLRDYLAARSAAQPIWPGTWPEKAAEMLRFDLEAAGIPYVVEGPDGPLHADFHSLRHSYIALLDKSGATLKEAMQLARHSDPKLTMAIYGRAQLHDLGQAVRKLPALLETGPEEATPLSATGTNRQPLGESLRQACAHNDAGCDAVRLHDSGSGKMGGNTNRSQPQVVQGVESGCDRMIPVETSSGDWDRTSDTRLMKRLSKPRRNTQNSLAQQHVIAFLPHLQAFACRREDLRVLAVVGGVK